MLPDNYLPPTLQDGMLLHQFHGAVKTRILQNQMWLYAMFCRPSFTEETIELIWPEANMQFFKIRHGGDLQSWNLSDVKLHELRAMDLWLISNAPRPLRS